LVTDFSMVRAAARVRMRDDGGRTGY